MRYSLENPLAYVESNLPGFTHILEACRHATVRASYLRLDLERLRREHHMPFSETQGVDHPLQFYAATKRANELMAHSYSHLFGCPAPACAFSPSTAPGAGRHGADSLRPRHLAGRPIDVFNHGKHSRDFTYIDDIVEGVIRAVDRPPSPIPTGTRPNPIRPPRDAPFRLYNIGNSAPVQLPISSRRSSRRWAARRSGSSCRCSPATCPTPSPTHPARPRGELAPRHPGRRGGAPLRRLVPRLRGRRLRRPHRRPGRPVIRRMTQRSRRPAPAAPGLRPRRRDRCRRRGNRAGPPARPGAAALRAGHPRPAAAGPAIFRRGL